VFIYPSTSRDITKEQSRVSCKIEIERGLTRINTQKPSEAAKQSNVYFLKTRFLDFIRSPPVSLQPMLVAKFSDQLTISKNKVIACVDITFDSRYLVASFQSIRFLLRRKAASSQNNNRLFNNHQNAPTIHLFSIRVCGTFSFCWGTELQDDSKDI
jgi:hypothetical protein